MRIRFLAVSTIIILLLFWVPLAKAAEGDSPHDDGSGPSLEEATEKEAPTTPTAPAALTDLTEKLKRGTFFMNKIKNSLQLTEQELQMLKKNKKVVEGKIQESRVTISDLNSQLENLDQLMLHNEEKIEAITLQIAATENNIKTTEHDIAEKEVLLHEQLESLDSLLTSYYVQNNTFFPENGAPDLITVLSTEESIGEILQKQHYLELLQGASEQTIAFINQTREILDLERLELDSKKKRLADLHVLLTAEKRSLEETKDSRQRLLQETKGKQELYEALLELSKKEVEQVSVQIARLKENYAFFEGKLAELEKNPDAFSFPDTLLADTAAGLILKGEEPLSWPVSPALGLSALFHDSAYKKTIGIAHNAIDIRIPQGSNVRSAGDGVVTKVVDNGFAYSYVIIAHPDSFMTLYGHLSDIMVSENEVVHQGQIIGLSGGTPGTEGAGWLTTGAHLHLEVFKNWEHVDPLDYLPLEFVPVSSLPEKYLKRLTGEAEEKTKRPDDEIEAVTE